MRSSRRSFQRGQSLPFGALNRAKNDVASSSQEEPESCPVMSNLVVQPRHAHIPDIGVDSNFIFEGMVFIYAVMTLCLQYINLYKTVWWLPHSNAKYALNFYLIDPHLSLLLVLVMSRRVCYCFVAEVYGSRSRCGVFYWLVQIIKVLVVGVVVAAFLYTSYRVVLRHSLLYSLFLCYPMVTYVILFRHSIKPLFGKTILVSQSRICTTSTGTSTAAPPTPGGTGADKTSPKHRPKEQITIHSRDIPSHNCSMSPETIRDEVEMLKTDFNNRIKQVLFNSMLCAYYMGFVPLCFAQNTLYYDTWWVGQHVCLIWISAFIMFMVHFLPAKYTDVLHRCALHLGHWTKVEGRHTHKPFNTYRWSELQVWQQGDHVKHVRGLFKAEGVNNSAEPGNSTHSRFHFMFYQPLRITNWLSVLTCALIAYQFLLLIQATEWSHILSLALLLFCSYYMLFKLMRDRFVLLRAYKEEQASGISSTPQ